MTEDGRGPDGEPFVDPAEVEEAFAESLERMLNLDTWQPGEDLADLYPRLEEQVREAVALEKAGYDGMRKVVLPMLSTRPGAPPGAGYYQATPAVIERVHRGLLFTGAVEACDEIGRAHV